MIEEVKDEEEMAVGKLEEEARRRKERLANLRKKIQIEENIETPKIELPNLPKPVFRSYNPKDEGLLFEGGKLSAETIEIENKVADTLEQGKVSTLLENVDLTNLAPRKPDWDLKRDIASKLQKLERQTQRAIAELILDRLKASQDLASVASIPDHSSKLVRPQEDDD